ncbi:MAG TPA: hypothetical protein VH593_15180, partial [Ktedonobacteraceae bacterium]
DRNCAMAALGHKTTRGQKLTRLVNFWPLVAVLTRERRLTASLISERLQSMAARVAHTPGSAVAAEPAVLLMPVGGRGPG